LVTQSTDLTVQNQTFQITVLELDTKRHKMRKRIKNSHVSSAQTGETRGLVATTRLDTDETVLNNVDTTNAVAASNSVGGQEKVDSVGSDLLLATLGVFQLDGNTLLEVNGEILGLVRGGERVLGELPHVRRGSDIGVLEDTGLVGAVGQVLVHGPGLGLGGGHGNVLLGGVGEQVVTAGEAVVENRVTPGGNDLDVGLQGVEGKLETDLVVTLAGATVRNSEASCPLYNFVN
jgi:hypothetical protein